MTSEMLMGVVRHLLGLAAGYLVSKGYMKGEYVDTLVSSIVGLSVVGWSIANKMDVQKKIDYLSPPVSQPSPPLTGPMSPTSPTATGWFKAVIAIALLGLAAPLALADSPPRQSKVWTPQELPPSVAPLSSAVYMSVIGSYASLDEEFSDGQFRAGLGIGYLAKFATLGVGVDFDATRHLNQDDFKFDNELDNWNFSARARVGWFVTPTLMPFASVGWARLFTQDTMSYGLGIESFTSERISLRFEATKYEIDDSLLDLKASINFKF